MIIIGLLVILAMVLVITQMYKKWKKFAYKPKYIEDMEKYPTTKVILNYGLFGGVLGSLLVFICGCVALFIHSIFELLNNSQSTQITMQVFERTLSDLFIVFIFIMIFGGVLGSIPAFIVGSYFAYKKTVIYSKQDFFRIFKVIALTVIVCGVPIALFSGDISGDIGAMIGATFFWALLCASCSVMLSFFVLPRGYKKVE